jgi:vancomycin resistance protein VanJ
VHIDRSLARQPGVRSRELTQRIPLAGRLTTGAAWTALGLVVGAWLLLKLADWHWVGTLLAFGPRWVLLLPVGSLAVCAGFWRPRALMPVGLAALMVAGPVMGLCVPMPAWGYGKEPGLRLRVLTCNTLVGRADWRLASLIELERPDVVTLQEWPTQQPLPAPLLDGWRVVRSQEIVVASRLPIATSETFAHPLSPSRTLGLRCELLTAAGPVQFFAVHLRSPRKGLEAVLRHWWGGLTDLDETIDIQHLEAAALGKWLHLHCGAVLIAGDFNLTPESIIYRRQFAHLQNAFSIAGWGWGGTKFTRYHSVRIDHILASASWRVMRCKVCHDVGSDHRPVIAEIDLQ